MARAGANGEVLPEPHGSAAVGGSATDGLNSLRDCVFPMEARRRIRPTPGGLSGPAISLTVGSLPYGGEGTGRTGPCNIPTISLRAFAHR